jgi:hypothetical protein
VMVIIVMPSQVSDLIKQNRPTLCRAGVCECQQAASGD